MIARSLPAKLILLVCLITAQIVVSPTNFIKANSTFENLSPPSNFIIENLGDGKSLKLSWEPSSPTVRYYIYKSIDNLNFEKILELPIQGSSYVDRAVEEGTKYFYRIISVDFMGNKSEPSVNLEAIAEKQHPAMPTGFELKLDDDYKTLYFQWNKNEEENLAGYNLYVSYDEVNYRKLNEQLVQEESISLENTESDSNLPHYRISAVNEFDLESPLTYALSYLTIGEKIGNNAIKNHQFIKDLKYWGYSSYQTISNNWDESTVKFDFEGYNGLINNGDQSFDSKGGSVKVELKGSNKRARTGIYQRKLNVIPNGDPVLLSFAWKKNYKNVNARRQQIWVDIVRPDSSWVRIWQDTTTRDMETYEIVENLDITRHFNQSGTYELRFMAWIETNVQANAEVQVNFDEVYLDLPRAPEVPLGLTVEPTSKGEALKISWLVSRPDVLGYNIYRSEREEYGVYRKINHELVTTNFYHDENLQNNQLYFYRVTAVDYRGLESIQTRHIRGVPNFIDELNHPHHSYSENTNACSSCHISHQGSNERLLTNASEAQVCLTCHNGTGSRYNTMVDFSSGNVAFHPVKGTEVSPDGEMSCSSCHNPHAGNGMRTTPRYAVGSLEAVPGVKVEYGVEPFTQPVTYALRSSIDYEYQLCFVCHSSYNEKPVDTVSTNTAKEFHPENLSGHHNVSEYQTSGFGSYINGWTADSPMFCTDCHGSSSINNHEGVHGSQNLKLLKQPFNERTKGMDSNNLCLTCHDPRSYGTGGNNQGKTRFWGRNKNINLHNINKHRVACAQCHSAVPHGIGRLPALLVTTEDPAPYQKYRTSTNTRILYPPDGDWSDKKTCGTNGNCH
ncbi:MAG: cytochrome c3 family protein [Anaerobacillus sp.]|uniref:cytochrome c3 family protein n=1 Tax=Anaerobacillus sp. TaxID=1872506 RepID=UPI00391CE9E3